jgi:hypothetical protein
VKVGTTALTANQFVTGETSRLSNEIRNFKGKSQAATPLQGLVYANHSLNM